MREREDEAARASEVKARVRRQFDRAAAAYQSSPLFAAGEDLAALIREASCTGRERVLDVATGTGHTAFALAAYAGMVVGLDLSEGMLQAAEEARRLRAIENVSFLLGDVEALPFPDESFELVTCRYAGHHFARLAVALQEIYRVLRVGGRLLWIDHYAPEDDELDAFINRLDLIRDPSHVREHRLSELRRLFAEAGLTYRQVVSWDLPLEVEEWLARAQTPPAARERVQGMLAAASEAARQIFAIDYSHAGRPIRFVLKCALLVGEKSGGVSGALGPSASAHGAASV